MKWNKTANEKNLSHFQEFLNGWMGVGGEVGEMHPLSATSLVHVLFI